MAKPVVIVGRSREHVPFLRGILTRSLQDAGLGFEDAYTVATAVRQQLGADTEISADDLRAIVVSHLAPLGEEVVRRYEHARRQSPTVLIQDESGDATPYSRGRYRLRLECCGLSADEAHRVASELNDVLLELGLDVIDRARLQKLTFDQLREDVGEVFAQRFLVWEEYRKSGRPMVVLIGGTAGCGKSTVSSSVALLLDIVRTQSTDMLREVMRTIVPKRLAPALHTSSFLAWQELPTNGLRETEEERTIAGYLTQAELLSISCEAVIQRALSERVSIVLDGIHVNPRLVARAATGDAIVVPIVLAVLKRELLRKRIQGRGKRLPDRRAQRYLDHFDAIWNLQTFLLSEADRAQVPIVLNEDKELAVQGVMGCIHDVLAKSFGGLKEPSEG